MPLSRRLPTALSACLLMAVAAGVSAQEPPAPPEPAEQRADHRALSDAVRRVERNTNGEVLSAERVQFDGRDLSRVKVIDDRGRVRVYWDDPQARPERDRSQRESRRDRQERADQAPRRAEPPVRTRRNDGPAFNL